MRNLIFTLFTFVLLLIMFVSSGFAQGTHKPITLGSSGAPYGYYEYLPQNYQQNGKGFPLLIFLHGAGEKGNGKSQLHEAVRHGPGHEVENGRHFPFVIISPQTSGWWDTPDLDKLIEHAISKYNIDRNRVYLTGLSMGAMGIYQYAGRHADKIAGIVGIAGSGRSEDICNYSDVPLWAFHGDGDGVVPVTGSMNVVNTYNKCRPKPAVEAKLTIIKGQGHSGWDDIYNGSKGDIYSWLLQYSKNGKAQPEPEPNKAPVADAGKDKVVNLPAKEVVLSGSAIDKDGRLTSFSWSKLNGPHVNMEGSNTANLSLKDLREGTYTFRFSAKDDQGATGSDDIQLKVKAAPADKNKDKDKDKDKNNNDNSKDVSVVADAGSDRTITLPASSESLHGSAHWVNCTVSSYGWDKVRGPSVKMSGANTANLRLKNLQEGEYVFRFTAISRSGVSGSDEVKLTVLKGGVAEDRNDGAPVDAVQGLKYSYYKIDPKKPWNKLPDMKSIKAHKEGRVDGFSLSPREQNDYFAFAYDGYIKIDKKGRYAFYTHTDEGSKVYIDDRLVVNNDGVHKAKVKYGWVNLSSGNHKIRVEYFENSGKERLYVSYKGPGVPLQAIPESVLSTQAGGASQAFARTKDAEALNATFEKSSEFRLYPNPARSDVHLDMGSLEEEVFLSITDLTGRRVYKSNFSATGTKALRLDLEAIGIKRGAYVLRIENQQGEMVKAIRFMKD